MSTTTFRMPESLTPFQALPFCAQLQRGRLSGEVVLDFANTSTTEPFGMLVVASEIERCIAANPDARFVCRNFKHMTYAGHMGFFKAFGHDFGREPGEAHGSRAYIPVTYFNSAELHRAAATAGLDVGDEIETQSRRLSETLLGADAGEVYETFAYSLREILRNVVEHASVERFACCAQYWPTKGRAEVAIVDRGIGVRESIKSNPHIDASTDKSALNFALMPAVSGKAFKGARRLEKRGPWTNSGFGLYLTSRICRNGGTFFIASGDTGMLLTHGPDGKGGKRYIPASLQGTAVRLNIHTANLNSLRESLERYRRDGYQIQQKYREIVSIDPSSASLMLSQDFDLGLWDRLLTTLRLRRQ